MLKKISATIITKNEEHNIEQCLKALSFVDEIVIVDSGSEDKTLEICKKYNCTIFQTQWLGFGKTKQLAVDKAGNDWILAVDADEIITDELKTEILAKVKKPTADGYRIKRNSFYLNKQIKHCGWNKDYTLRLFNKNKGSFNDRLVHESVQIPSDKIGTIHQPMLHFTFPTVDAHLSKMIKYARLSAEQKWAKGHTASPPKAIFAGTLKFIKMYIIQLGFLDGKFGFLLSVNSAYGVYLKYIYLWEKTNG
jgi:glycosyltransferase involved in cell wall biosynthesis